jgi:hypothetical protein
MKFNHIVKFIHHLQVFIPIQLLIKVAWGAGAYPEISRGGCLTPKKKIFSSFYVTKIRLISHIEIVKFYFCINNK